MGVGDDAAVIDPSVFCNRSSGGITLTTDTIADGTHFDLSQHSLEQIGWKAMGVNFSDLAAMGARPIAALVTFLVPQQFELPQLQQLFLGCKSLADRHQVAIIGGDTNRWSGPLVVSVTALGRQPRIEGEPVIWSMSGARPGDRIVVSGVFGGSLLGRHLSCEPRVELAHYLATHYQVRAATDVSDSLSLDLQLMANASGREQASVIGIEVEADKIPVAVDAQLLSKSSGRTALQHALYDGEDFELVLALDSQEWRRIQADSRLRESAGLWGKLTEIGRFTNGPDFRLLTGEGVETILPGGYSH